MKSEYIFPTVLIMLDIMASIPYGVKGNMRMMIYWLSAATLTACVTYKQIKYGNTRYSCEAEIRR